jgi:integrase/recombinase XerD
MIEKSQSSINNHQSTIMNINASILELTQHLHARGYAQTTIACYRKALRPFTRYLADRGITDLRRIRHQEILEYQAAVMAESTAMETKAQKLRAVKRLFEYLHASHQLLLNPTEGIVETCRKGRKLGPVLSVAQVQRLLAQPNLSLPMQQRDRALMDVLYATGIRLNELLQLEVYQVDLRERVLQIRCGKGRRQRVVPLSQAACRSLKRYLEQVRPWQTRKNRSERSLFLLRTGRPMTPESVREILRKYRVSAGISTPVSPHTFRRSCATHLLQQGADIRYIQQLLGHRHVRTTQFYTRVSPKEVKATHSQTHPGRGLPAPHALPGPPRGSGTCKGGDAS